MRLGIRLRIYEDDRLLKNDPVMTIEHHLMNTGAKPMATQVYDHNFLVIDHQGAGPAIEITFPFAPKPTKTLDLLAEVRGKQLVFPKELRGNDTFYGEFRGFGKTADDYEIRVENKRTGAGVVVTCDQPLANLGVWAVKTVVAPEPYITIRVPVARDFRRKYTYTFYTRGTSDHEKR